MLCGLLVSVLCYGVALAILWWLIISVIPLPEPFVWVARLIFALAVIYVLFSIINGGGHIWIAAEVCRGGRL